MAIFGPFSIHPRFRQGLRSEATGPSTRHPRSAGVPIDPLGLLFGTAHDLLGRRIVRGLLRLIGWI